MTKYFWMNTKFLLTNPHIIFWSILFIEFWVFMWAYVFGASLPPIGVAVKTYLAMAYGNLLMLSISSIATAIASGLLYSSKSLRYVTKYTRLSPSRFLLENFLSSLSMLLIVSGIMFASVLIVFYAKFGFMITPVNPIGLLLTILLGNLFVYALSLFQSFLIIVLRAPKSASFTSYLPLILAFIAYSALWVDFNIAVYISPFNCISSTCYYFISGESPPTGNYFMPNKKTLVNVSYAIFSLAAWILLLTLLDILLLKK